MTVHIDFTSVSSVLPAMVGLSTPVVQLPTLHPKAFGGKGKSCLNLKWRGRVRKVFEKHYEELYGLSFFFLHSRAAAQDVVSNVFFAALSRWPIEQVYKISNLRAYLRRSVQYGSLNALKRQNRMNNLPAATSTLFENCMDNHALNIDLEKLLSKLPARQAEAFRLLLAGYSHQEIAAIMQLSTVGASKTLVYYARQKLIKLWKEMSDFDPDDGGGKKDVADKQKREGNDFGRVVPEPETDDLLRLVDGQRLDADSKFKIMHWLIVNEHALFIISGLQRAIQGCANQEPRMNLKRGKDILRRKLFGDDTSLSPPGLCEMNSGSSVESKSFKRFNSKTIDTALNTAMLTVFPVCFNTRLLHAFNLLTCAPPGKIPMKNDEWGQCFIEKNKKTLFYFSISDGYSIPRHQSDLPGTSLDNCRLISCFKPGHRMKGVRTFLSPVNANLTSTDSNFDNSIEFNYFVCQSANVDFYSQERAVTKLADITEYGGHRRISPVNLRIPSWRTDCLVSDCIPEFVTGYYSVNLFRGGWLTPDGEQQPWPEFEDKVPEAHLTPFD